MQGRLQQLGPSHDDVGMLCRQVLGMLLER